MATSILAEAVLAPTSGLVKDAIVNTFAIEAADDIDGSNYGALTTLLTTFYTHAGTGSRKVSDYIGRRVSRAASACKWRLYDIAGHLDGSAHGSPFAEDSFTMPAPGSDLSMPEEVAVVVTLRAEGWQTAVVDVPGGAPGPAGDTRPKQSKSGRIFVGPLTGTSCHGLTENSAIPEVDADFVVTLLDAAEYMGEQLIAATPSMSLCVWSRKLESLTPVTDFQVDNAFDTVRKRGHAATVRTTRNLI